MVITIKKKKKKLLYNYVQTKSKVYELCTLLLLFYLPYFIVGEIFTLF